MKLLSNSLARNRSLVYLLAVKAISPDCDTELLRLIAQKVPRSVTK
jgi:hypothetical protein